MRWSTAARRYRICSAPSWLTTYIYKLLEKCGPSKCLEGAYQCFRALVIQIIATFTFRPEVCEISFFSLPPFFCAGERWKPLWLFRVEIGNALACTDIAACRSRKRGMIFIVLETILKRMRFLWGIQRAYLPDCRCTFSLHNRQVFLFATHRHGPPATGLAIGPPTDTAHPTQARPTNFPGPTRPVHKQYMTSFVFVAHIGRSDLSEAQEIPTCRFLYRRSETNRLLPWS